jgi:hypothetical protein
MMGMAGHERERRSMPPDEVAGHRQDLNRRLRLAFLAGAEERSRQDLGRGLTEAELRAILDRYPGDVNREGHTFL